MVAHLDEHSKEALKHLLRSKVRAAPARQLGPKGGVQKVKHGGNLRSTGLAPNVRACRAKKAGKAAEGACPAEVDALESSSMEA